VRRSHCLPPLLCTAAFICTAVSILPAAAIAADNSDSRLASTDATLGEVVVTAQKRTETIRAVPQSVSVLSGEQIEMQHIDDYADLATTVPSLSYSSWGGPGLSNLEIRGISSTIGESTVSIYLDDAPITIRNNSFYAGQPEPQLFDLARAEVLRGPQGTLYGASAMGGTIKLESNPVNLNNYEGEAYQELSGTKHGGLNYVTRGVLNLPLVDGTLGLRLGLQTSRDSGYVDHVTTGGVVDGKGINANRTNAVKFALTYMPADTLKITLSEFAQRTVMDDTGLVNFETPNYYINKQVAEPGRDSFSVTSLKINYDLNWADLTSVSSYAWRQFPRTTDGTYFNSVFVGFFVDQILGLPGLDGNLDGYKLAALPGPVYNSLSTKQWTQELRLSSKAYDPNAGLPISWLAGLYISDAKYVGSSYQYIPGFNQTFLATYGIPPLQALGAATPNDLFYQFVNELDDREYAVFGEFSYYPMPRLRLIGSWPAATSLAPSVKIARASTVAVVVPSPATSEVFDATSFTICAPMFWNLFSSSISLATVTPSLVTVGAPHDFSITTLRPRGPRVTLTVSASVLTPCSSRCRASSEKLRIFAMYRSLHAPPP